MSNKNKQLCFQSISVFLTGLLMFGCNGAQQAPCPNLDSSSYTAKDAEHNIKVDQASLFMHDSSAMTSFELSNSQPLGGVIKALQHLRFDGSELLKIRELKQDFQLKPLSLTKKQLQFLITDLHEGHPGRESLMNELYRFIQSGGAVGLMALDTPFQGDVNTAVGNYYYSGPRKVYVLITGDYPVVRKTFRLLRDDNNSKHWVKENEFTIFVKEKIKSPTTFPDETLLTQFRSVVQEKEKHQILFDLNPVTVSPESKASKKKSTGLVAPENAMTCLRGEAELNRRGALCKAPPEQRPPHVMEIEVPHKENSLELRQLFLYAAKDYAPRIRQIYADKEQGIKIEKYIGKQKGKASPFESQFVEGYIDTSRSFDELRKTPLKGSENLSPGSPTHAQEQIGAFYLRINTKKLLTDRVYRTHVALYPSKTGQGSGEAASRFYSTALPVNKWTLTADDVKTCQTDSSDPKCGKTFGFESFHEKMLKACIPFDENNKNREKIAEFYYYFTRK